MSRNTDILITVTACLAAFAVGVIGVSVYAWWDVSRRMI